MAASQVPPQGVSNSQPEDFQPTRFETISPFVKFIEAVKNVETGSEIYTFQCQLCLPAEQYSKSHKKSPVSNLKSHIVKRHGPKLLEDFTNAWDSRPGRSGGGGGGPKPPRALDDSLDPLSAIEDHEEPNSKNLHKFFTLQTNDGYQVTQEAVSDLRSEDLRVKFGSISPYFKFIEAAKNIETPGSEIYTFQCLLCLPEEQYLKSHKRAPVSNLKAHISHRHGPALVQDFNSAWRNT